MGEAQFLHVVSVLLTAKTIKEEKMRTPRKPISREARDHLRSKLSRMKGIEKEKTVKRLQMYDRGFRKKREEEWERE